MLIIEFLFVLLLSIPFILMIRLFVDHLKNEYNRNNINKLDKQITRLKANLKSLNDNRNFIQNNKYNRSFTTYNK